MGEKKSFADIPEMSPHVRTERRYLPVDEHRQDLVSLFRASAGSRITKLCLNNPNEHHKLWVFEHASPGAKSTYETILKDQGTMRQHGLERAEFRGPIYREVFEYYEATDVPSITTYRYRPNPHVSLDFGEDDNIRRAESDNPAAWDQFLRAYKLDNYFIDATNDKRADSEWLAHNAFRNLHGGRQAYPVPVRPEVGQMFEDIETLRDNGSRTVVMLGGRSGAGKSYTVRELQKKLSTHRISSSVISTDDYNKGRTHLFALAESRGEHRWVNYESDEVYDLSLFMSDVRQLINGHDIPKYAFNFDTEEREQVGTVSADTSEVIIVEGIMATHPLLHGLADLSYEIPTLTATSLGQRSFRDYDERPQFAHPRKNVPYYMTFVEPAFRSATGRGKPLRATPQIIRRMLDEELRANGSP
jgi:uridine kinase